MVKLYLLKKSSVFKQSRRSIISRSIGNSILIIFVAIKLLSIVDAAHG
jgi:hypothetical protein